MELETKSNQSSQVENKNNLTSEKSNVSKKRINISHIPDELLNNSILNEKISSTLPNNYNFEIHKTIWRLRTNNSKRVALQFPEGLFIFSTAISDILEQFACVEVVIMADVTYGACCIDDYTAGLLECDCIVHYGHSCLIPVNQMINGIKVLYVFVDIKFDLVHLVRTVVLNFDPVRDTLALGGTIQFVSSIHYVGRELREKYGFKIHIPQSKPLSPGEVLGCTASNLPSDINKILFIADGRFHLEAVMIANPNIQTFKYNPYNKEITKESYDFEKMYSNRERAIHKSSQVCANQGTFGLILGTLGRQGNPKVLNHLINNLTNMTKCNYVNLLLPEVKPEILNLFTNVDSWVQIACPRLSIDWGDCFTSRPLLTPYEMNVAIKSIKTQVQDVNKYPMDFYASNSLGNWTPNHKCNPSCSCQNN